MNREQKPEHDLERTIRLMNPQPAESDIERQARLMMNSEQMTEAERAHKRAADVEYERLAAKWRRQARWDYLRSKEFRANVWSTFAGVGALWLGFTALDHPDDGEILFVYVLIASAAIAALVHKLTRL